MDMNLKIKANQAFDALQTAKHLREGAVKAVRAAYSEYYWACTTYNHSFYEIMSNDNLTNIERCNQIHELEENQFDLRQAWIEAKQNLRVKNKKVKEAEKAYKKSLKKYKKSLASSNPQSFGE